jgi:XapX domain-containing protein
MKAVVGLGLAFALGFACRAFGIPSPAPPVVVGALLVMAMTIGYVLVDRFVATHPARHEADCGGPSGLAPSALGRKGEAAHGTPGLPRPRP